MKIWCIVSYEYRDRTISKRFQKFESMMTFVMKLNERVQCGTCAGYTVSVMRYF